MKALPLAVPESVDAQATFVAATLGQHLLRKRWDDARAAEVQNIALEVWKDPRGFASPRERPQTPGWRSLQAIEPGAYAALVEGLISADLELFFNSIEFDQERRQYWLGHLPNIVSTSFIFCDETRELLRSKFREGTAAHEQVTNALRRSRQLADRCLDVLCLTFRSGIVIEFSRKGNAAYLYRRGGVSDIIPPNGRVRASELRDRVRGEQMCHFTGWDRKFDQELAGIF